MSDSITVKPAAAHIEFAHIYADAQFGKEQAQAAQELTNYLRTHEHTKPIITSVLIDDYNPLSITLNEQELLSELTKQGATVDFVAYESQFVGIAEQLIRELPFEQKHRVRFSTRDTIIWRQAGQTIGLKNYSATTPKYTCAILSAAWTLCRLGAFPFPAKSISTQTNKTPYAEKIITFLPKKYQATEEKMKQIIAATRFQSLLPRVEHYFF